MASFRVLVLSLIAVLMGSMSAAHSTPFTTPYEIGPGRIMNDFTTSGGKSATSFHVVDLPILAMAQNTGSLTVKTNGYDGKAGTKYASICIPNPLRNMGTGSGRTYLNRGSGSVLFAAYHVDKGGAAVGGDIGFTKSCVANGTGTDLFDDVVTATGATNQWVANGTNKKIWQGQEFIKLGLRGSPGGGYKANLFLIITDAAGSK